MKWIVSALDFTVSDLQVSGQSGHGRIQTDGIMPLLTGHLHLIVSVESTVLAIVVYVWIYIY